MLNLPASFIKNIQSQLPGEADDLLNAPGSNKEVVSIRINNEKINSPKNLNPVPWCGSGYYLSERPVFTLDPVFHSGCYYVQEASSMFLEQFFLQHDLHKQNLKVLDLCAAPGGKSTHIISIINNESLLVANEVIRPRTAVVAENLSKWGKPNYVVTNNDAKDFKVLENYFDVIVCDVPCSGEGMFRKDPKAIKEWSEESVLHCAQRQKRIVADAWNALKPGGYMIYSTCTFNKHENEENVKWIMTELGGECVQPELKNELGIVTSEFGCRFYPHKLKGEGFFISLIKKRTGDFVQKKIKSNERIKRNNEFNMLTGKNIFPCNDWITDAGNFLFITENNLIRIVPEHFCDDLKLLKQNLNVIEYGTLIAQQKGRDFIPQQSLAGSMNFHRNHFKNINFDLKDSLRYLKGETNFNLDADNGFVLICYHPGPVAGDDARNNAGDSQQTYPLGFAKKTGTRMNNHYPKNRMIKMNIDFEKIKSNHYRI